MSKSLPTHTCTEPRCTHPEPCLFLRPAGFGSALRRTCPERSPDSANALEGGAHKYMDFWQLPTHSYYGRRGGENCFLGIAL